VRHRAAPVSETFTDARGSCFDVAFMGQRARGRLLKQRQFKRLVRGLPLLVAFMPVLAHAEPSVANLLRPAPAPVDPTAELADTLHTLERRAPAGDEPVRAALDQTRRELLLLRDLAARGADDAALERHMQIVWAALSWVDRLEARTELAARLAEQRALAESAEAAAELARAQAAAQNRASPP
jgi:hypothetical protein